MENSIKISKKEKLEQKIEKYYQLIQKENSLEIKKSELKIEINNAKNEISLCRKDLLTEKEKIKHLKSKVIVDDENKEFVNLVKREKGLESELQALEREKIKSIDKMTRAKVEISRLRKESRRLSSLRKELRIFDMLQQSVSKKGIPLQIMMTQLPIINNEISKILHGVVGFTVELETKGDANTMDIYINYGDSRRIIELASGMEKMMASLALRVALINISSLPKTNMLVIDEGFGALDETNIEACSRLLTSLKKWFKNIIIISHVDAIKDTVDNFLEISKKEKDARVYYE
jgi:exonuclease SbcC